ncbi:GGDEF domain-containing protein [Paenibacillus chitinolyticus]|uniref:GGDEF domain-containing protein n=1 Tax=Paenibacillus chitinolyticus TaxID=79263 RepID=UPI00295ED2C3|nr:GGDEF domain-containing protein [Paenibacillus chitinolyticus]
MNIVALFSPQTASFISSLLLLPILIIYWVLSRKLPAKKAGGYHLSTKISLLVGCIYLLYVSFLFKAADNKLTLNVFEDFLFFLILYSFILAVTKQKTSHQIIVYAAFAAAALLSFTTYHMLFSTLLVLGLIGAAWWYINVKIHSGMKERIALLLFTLHKFVQLLTLILSIAAPSVWMISTLSYIAAVIVLLSKLVDQLFKIMHGTYESANSDYLTGLYNRRYFVKCVQQGIEKKLPSKIIFIDIDNFKKLNDTQGHAKGDEVLVKVSRVLQQEVEEIGIAGRYGGEELVALIVDPNVEMEELTETIRTRIMRDASSEGEYTVTASIGYSDYCDFWTTDQFIKTADKAMYAAKQTGKNKVIEYGSSKYLEYEQKVTVSANNGSEIVGEAGAH